MSTHHDNDALTQRLTEALRHEADRTEAPVDAWARFSRQLVDSDSTATPRTTAATRGGWRGKATVRPRGARWRLPVLAAAAVIAVTVTFAITTDWFGTQDNQAASPGAVSPSVEVSPGGDELLPGYSLTDWVSFSDYVVAATVTAERELPSSKEEVAAGEGFIPRVITIRVDDVLWSRDHAPELVNPFEAQLDGWVFHGDTKNPQRNSGQPMMAVGTHVVMPIVDLPAEGIEPAKSWSPLSSNSIIPVNDNILGEGDTIIGTEEDGSVRDTFTGKTVDQLATAVNATQPYPQLDRKMDLPPYERFQLVPDNYEALAAELEAKHHK